MILVSKLPSQYDVISAIFSQNEDINKLEPQSVQTAAVNLWEQKSKVKGKAKEQSANKLSAVKKKGNNPQWQNQRQPQGQASGSGQQSGGQNNSQNNNGGNWNKTQRGTRGGKKVKERQQGQHHESELDALVQPRPRELLDGPFPGEREDPEAEIDDLQDGQRLDYRVEIRGEEVPEDFGPEECF